MKKMIVVFLLMSMVVINANAWWVSWGHMKETKDPETGEPIRECVGAGVCAGGGGKATLHLYNKKTDLTKQAEIDIKVKGNSMTIVIKKLIGAEKEKVFTVDEDTYFDDESAKKLRYRSLMLKKGEYPIEYSRKYPNGRVIVEIVAKK